MDSEKVIKRDGEYVLHTYNRNPIVLEKATVCVPSVPKASSIWILPAASVSTVWATVIWTGPKPFPSRPISCSTPPTSTTRPPAASWPKSCASAPA